VTSGDFYSPGSQQLIREVEQAGETFRVGYGAGEIVWCRWGAGPALVLAHGGGGSWLHWIKNIPFLSRHYTIWAPDLPGHGDSDLPSGEVVELLPGERDDLVEGSWGGQRPLPIAVSARLIAAGLDRLVPSERLSLVGFSFGGAVISHVCARLPRDRVRNIVLCGTVGLMDHTFGKPQYLQSWKGIEDREAFRAVHRHNLTQMLFGDASRIDDLAIDIQTLSTRNTRVRRAERRPTTLDALMKARPVLSGIWGSADVTARAGIDAVRAALTKVDGEARLHVVPGAGHWVAYEAADEFNSALLTLLARQREPVTDGE